MAIYREPWLKFVFALLDKEAGINSCQKGKMTINQRTYITYRPLRMECFGEIRVRTKDELEIIAIFHSSRASV